MEFVYCDLVLRNELDWYNTFPVATENLKGMFSPCIHVSYLTKQSKQLWLLGCLPFLVSSIVSFAWKHLSTISCISIGRNIRFQRKHIILMLINTDRQCLWPIVYIQVESEKILCLIWQFRETRLHTGTNRIWIFTGDRS